MKQSEEYREDYVDHDLPPVVWHWDIVRYAVLGLIGGFGLLVLSVGVMALAAIFNWLA